MSVLIVPISVCTVAVLPFIDVISPWIVPRVVCIITVVPLIAVTLSCRSSTTLQISPISELILTTVPLIKASLAFISVRFALINPISGIIIVVMLFLISSIWAFWFVKVGLIMKHLNEVQSGESRKYTELE